jgi:hypothetical protein
MKASWRIPIGGRLKRAQIIRGITLAWLVLLIVGSLHPARMLVVVGSLKRDSNPLVFVESLPPAAPLVAIGSFQAVMPGPVVVMHRAIHWLAFGGAAFLQLLLSRNRRQEMCSVIATCLLGLSLEYLQHLIYHIPMEWYDVRAENDALAALVALALYRLAGTSMDEIASTWLR